MNLEVEYLRLLCIGDALQLLVISEELGSSLLDLTLVNTPHFAEICQNASFGTENVDGSFLGDVGQTHDTVRDSLGFQNPNPADLSSVVSVRSTASLDIDALNIDYAKRVPRHDTALIKTEPIFSLGFRLVHEAFADVVTVVDQAVGHVLDVSLLLACQTLVVRNVKMGLFCCLLGSSLPDVWPKHLSARSKD